MTPSQAAQEKPTSPRTADQRTSIYRMREWLSTFGPDAVIYDGTWRVGRPIDLFERALTEREAAAATPSQLLRAVVEEVEAEEKRWLEWWARGAKGAFVWKRDAVRAAREALDGN